MWCAVVTVPPLRLASNFSYWPLAVFKQSYRLNNSFHKCPNFTEARDMKMNSVGLNCMMYPLENMSF